MKDIKEYRFIKRWRKHHRKVIMRMYPTATKKEINEYLDELIDKNLINYECEIHNNYVHKTIKTNLLEVYDWIIATKPICAGFGVFFRNQNNVLNLAAVMLDKFGKLRAKIKGTLKDLVPDSYEYRAADNANLVEKTNSNSFYGCAGNKTSPFYNLYTATSTTSTGQSLISTTDLAYEAFLVNTVLFNTLDECFVFITNIIGEVYTLDTGFLKDVTLEQVETRLIGNFYNFKEVDREPLNVFLNTLTQEELNKVYYKNNLYEFSKIKKIDNILYQIFDKVTEFKNPNKIPVEAEDELTTLWAYYREFVFYNYAPFERIQRLRNDKRGAVVAVDTDSNIISLLAWVEYVTENFMGAFEEKIDADTMGWSFIVVNTMAYCLTNMIKETLQKYTKTANVVADYAPRINMKNEFLFTVMILASKKKRYISSVRLREGNEIFPEKLDIKGHDFAKSTVTETTKKFCLGLISKHIIGKDNIDIQAILRESRDFEIAIAESLLKGEKDYLLPKSVKELASYKDPMSEQGVKAVIMWNLIYPTQTIDLPVKLDIVKLDLPDLATLEKIRHTFPEMYDTIATQVFGNKNPEIAKKGIEVLAIPTNILRVPEWVTTFIDTETIVVNNISKFYPVMEAIGINIITTSKRSYFSNIIDL